MPDKEWMRFKMPFGKCKGRTLYDLYLNERWYLLWIDTTAIQSPEVRKNIDAAIEYINMKDPV